ncbi:reverse transcriptase domain-containing protein [Tanacetum coccineum]
MAKKDEEKTTFHTDEGAFYYTKMPFRLKNSGATYQRLVDTIFEGQMGRNLEAYVDDMVIKSKTMPEMIKDVEETLLSLKKVNMKLNPKTCSFEMEVGKFLGYIVTSEGIRANPEKAKAVVNMPSPSNLKQMQRLSGKLVALNRSLFKAAERALPCLDTLKKCTNKKDFHWTPEAEEAFQAMKKLIAKLTTLMAPKKEEDLMVYLSVANEAVSVVLLVERCGRQASIHYVSKTLQGAEINYPPMEKLSLALVYAARRLRRYFQGHTIKVITDKPISQILNNREATRRLAKWGVELEAYGIKYAPKSAIKGQVLTDFLADTMVEDNFTQVKTKGPNDTSVEGESMEEQEATETKALENLRTKTDIWKLYTDGASNEHGSGAGLILIDPEGAEYYALRLNFANSNNDAEYEALLAGLRIATKMKVERMHVFVDSKLVASQCEGLTKGVLIEELNERSVDTTEVNAIIEEATRTWMTPIQEYTEKKILLEDATEARTIRKKARNYTVEKGVYATVPKLPKNNMISITSAWPFQKWGMDTMGPLPEAPGKIKYLIVAVDYFTKWFGIPATIITDNGNDLFKSWVEGLGIQLVSTLVYHPQVNEAVE